MEHRMRRRTAGLVSVVALIGSLAGCAGASKDASNQEPHRGGTLTVFDTPGVDESLDPATAYSGATYAVAYATQRPLYDYKPGARYAGVIPDLATAMPAISADARTVTVHIRSGVMFSPPVNREVTSSDVKFAIERGFMTSVACPYALTYFASVIGAPTSLTKTLPSIRGIATPDAHTLVFHLSQPAGAVVAGALVLPLSAPVPQSYAAPFDRESTSTYSTHVVATGPYMVQRNSSGKLSYVPGKSVVLVRNPNWNAGTDHRPAYLDQIDIKLTEGDDTIYAKQVLAGHDEEESVWTPPADLETALKDTPHQENLSASGLWYSVAMNTQAAPLNNVNVRRALIVAVNRNAMSDLYGGHDAGPLNNQYLAPGMPGYAQAGGALGPDLAFMRHPDGDIALAHQYLVRAGYPDGRLPVTIDIAAYADPISQRLGSFLAAQLAPLGVKVQTIVKPDSDTSCSTPAKQADLCVADWQADFGDGESALQPEFDGDNITKTNNYNSSQLNVAAIDEAMARADGLPAGPQRVAAWVKIDRMITSEAPGIPQNFSWLFLPESKDVHGVVTAEIGYDLSYTWVS